uniref:Aspartic proteinase Asp1 n=1 Tax=Solanum tuberosum TaxID=4113 RepID=M1AZQ0_SOLTU
MALRPADYLVHMGFVEGAAMWCIGFEKQDQGVTILGDLVLKDKIIVYDLARQRIGWTDYDCKYPILISDVYYFSSLLISCRVISLCAAWTASSVLPSEFVLYS